MKRRILSPKLVPAGLLVSLTVPVGLAESPDRDYTLSAHHAAVPASVRMAGMVDAGRDRFPAEAAAAQIAESLAGLAESLKADPGNLVVLRGLLADGFLSSGWGSSGTELRAGPRLQLHRSVRGTGPPIGPGAFLERFRSLIADFALIGSAEFEIVRVEATDHDGQRGMRTAIHYALAGKGHDAVRLQRTGDWTVDWIAAPDSGWKSSRWDVEETASARTSGPLFADVTERALGHSASYREQVLPGVDHWRDRLDAALGIDVYGHHGVSVGDMDGDGDDDLYVSQPGGLPNRLYRNDGAFRFTDVTDEAGTGVLDNTSMSLFADLDNDGDQDLLLVTGSTLLHLRNEAGRGFRNVVGAFEGVAMSQGQFTSAALADYDRDGDLDIYVCAYRFQGGTGVRHAPTPYHDANNGPPNRLLRNRGDGTFEDVTAAAGLLLNNRRFSFAAAWADFDSDAWPDLYVANDFGRNNLYRNNGDGTFTDVASRLGVEDIGAGMSVDWLDFDGDGRLDLYLGNMWSSAGKRLSAQVGFHAGSSDSVRSLFVRHARGNSLFRATDTGGFEDVTLRAGVAHGRWAWASGPLDFDSDGHEDLYVANGYVTNTRADDL